MRLKLLAIIGLLSACAQGRHNASAPLNPPLSKAERNEAIDLVQYDTTKGPYVADADIVPIARAVRLVRRAFPQGNDVSTDVGSSLELILTDSATSLLRSQFPSGWTGDTTVRATGIPSIDSLNAELHIERVLVHLRSPGLKALSRSILQPLFPGPIYRATVAQHFQSLFDVHLALYGISSSGFGGLSASPTPSGFKIGFGRGWGDCAAGCIHKHHWVFDVNLRTNRVVKIRDDGSPWPAPPGTSP